MEKARKFSSFPFKLQGDIDGTNVDNSFMEPFLPTLLGAFLGISVPFVVSSILSWRRFRRATNVLFTYYQTETQGYQARSHFIAQQTAHNKSMTTIELHALANKNFHPSADLVSTFISQYSSYLKSEDVFYLSQDIQNMQILLHGLIHDEVVDPNALMNAINHVIEFSARRTFNLFRVSARVRAEFSVENYEILINELNRSQTKTLIRINRRRIARAFKKHAKDGSAQNT